MSLAGILTALIAASTPGTDTDLSFADPTPPRGPDLSPAALEARTSRETKHTRALDLTSGDTVFVLTEVKLPRRAARAVQVRTTAVRADRGISTAAWAELVKVGPRSARVRYAVRAGNTYGGPPRGLRFSLEVRSRDGKTIVNRRVEHAVQVRAANPGPEDIAADAEAYRYHQAAAQRAYHALPELKTYLRLDRVDRPPSPGRLDPHKLPILQEFLHHRLRADVARARLRAFADLPAPAIALEAAKAIGGLSAKPTGPAARARAIEGVGTDKALDLAARALDDLQIDEAEGMLNRIRTSGRLERAQLARALALLGQVHFLRGHPAAATKALGSAVCLEPELDPGPARPALRARLDRSRAANPCPDGLTILEVTPRRVLTEEGSSVRVQVKLARDPHGVLSGGVIERWGFGGRVDLRRTASVTTIDGSPYLLVELPDDESSLSTDRILLKVLAKDLSGVLLASFGDPDPVSMQIVNAEAAGVRGGVPTWVWWVAGSLALVGGVAAGAWAVSREEEVQRRIGPVDVRF